MRKHDFYFALILIFICLSTLAYIRGIQGNMNQEQGNMDLELANRELCYVAVGRMLGEDIWDGVVGVQQHTIGGNNGELAGRVIVLYYSNPEIPEENVNEPNEGKVNDVQSDN